MGLCPKIAVPIRTIVLPAAMVVSAVFGVGLWFIFDPSAFELPAGSAASLLCGIGLIAASVSLTAILMLAGNVLVRAIGRYTRLRFHLLPRVSQPGTPHEIP